MHRIYRNGLCTEPDDITNKDQVLICRKPSVLKDPGLSTAGPKLDKKHEDIKKGTDG